MRVAINLLYLIPGVVGGTETYAAGLLAAFAAARGDHEFVLFTNREAAERFPDLPENFRQVVCGVDATNRASRYAYEQGVLPTRVAAARPDVLHSLGYVGPLRAPCPHVVSIPDLNFVGHGAAMPGFKRRVLGAFVRMTAARADHIITISEFSRGQIAARFGLDAASRITVTHLAGRPAPEGPADPALLAHYGAKPPYVVAFASQSPHKNIPRLLEAFAMASAGIEHTLVLIGHLPTGGLAPPASARSGRVVYTGYVPDAHVMPLLAGADAFVFPSSYEGFGLPLLDAQACGVPVACSSAGSLPEVAGDGALVFDPTSVTAIAAAIRTLATDERARAALRARGRANVVRFSWSATAERTFSVYRGAARGARSRP